MKHWHAGDPREYVVNCNRNFMLIIVSSPHGLMEGEVHTEFSWVVHFDKADPVSADDSWPDGWIWTARPSVADRAAIIAGAS